MTGTHESILDFSDLMSATLRGDDVQGFDSRWDEVLLLIEDLQLDTLLERSHKMRIRESQHLNTVLAEYKDMPPSYQRLKTMVKQFLDQKMRARNLVARKERTVQGAPAKSRTEKKSVSVDRKQGDCRQREANGTCTKGDACSVRHDESKRGKRACSSSSTPKSPLKIDVKNSSQGRPPREISSKGKRLLKPCTDYHALESVQLTLWSRQTKKLLRRCMKWRRSLWTVRRPTLTQS